MGKQGESLTTTTVSTTHKNKRKNSIFSKYTDIIKQAEAQCQKQTEQVIPKIHKLINKHRKKLKTATFYKIQDRIRICRVCKQWNHLREMKSCAKCEDNYHSSCAKIKKQGLFICNHCQNQGIRENQCHKCHQTGIQMKKCKNCIYYFHTQCLKSKKLCQKCFNLSQLQACKKSKSSSKQKQLFSTSILNENTNTSRNSYVKFVYPKLIQTAKNIKKYKASLLQAITKKGMRYNEQLVNWDVYQDIMNENSMDFGIEYMNKSQIKLFEQYKKQPIGPYLLEEKQNKGFDVIADKDIPYKTLICQYVGEVFTHRQIIEHELSGEHNDSLMELQRGKNSDETLFIMPHRYTNIARFLNGVKNPKNANVTSMKILYKGRPTVLLLAARHIKKGESLVYDYNAGGISSGYDTSHFVDDVK